MEKKKNVITAVKSLNDKCQLVRFADYFAICGLDYEAGLEVDRYSGKYTTKIIAKQYNLVTTYIFL